MQDRPNIGTAIPKRRYQVGDYSATVLGEVETSDPRQYRYILAMVPMGQRTPTLYITCEAVPPRESAQGNYHLRLINEASYAVDNMHPEGAAAPSKHIYGFTSWMQGSFY